MTNQEIANELRDIRAEIKAIKQIIDQKDQSTMKRTVKDLVAFQSKQVTERESK